MMVKASSCLCVFVAGYCVSEWGSTVCVCVHLQAPYMCIVLQSEGQRTMGSILCVRLRLQKLMHLKAAEFDQSRESRLFLAHAAGRRAGGRRCCSVSNWTVSNRVTDH